MFQRFLLCFFMLIAKKGFLILYHDQQLMPNEQL